MRGAAPHRRATRIGSKLRPPDQLAERREEMVGVQRDIQRPTLRRMNARQPTGAGIASDITALILRPYKPPGLYRQRAPQQRQAEVLPRTTALAPKQRSGDAIRKQRRREIVQHRTKHQLRRIGAAALEHRHPAQALQHLVEAALLAERPCIAIPRQPGVDQSRIDRAKPRIIDPEPRRHRGPKILHQHIRARHHALQNGQPLRCFQIKRQCPFATIGSEKEPTLALEARRKLPQHVALR